MSQRVVVLNGTSSAGKSTLAESLGAKGCENWTVVSIDKMFAMLHPSRRNDWATYLALTKALFQTAKVMRASGFFVVVDTVFEREECLHECRNVLGEFVLVGVHCPIPFLEDRERQRDNRPLGLARGQIERVHGFCTYDAELDTGVLTPEDCVQAVLQIIGEGG